MDLFELAVASKLAGGGGGGGGGLEYEMGVVVPTEYSKTLTIPFQNTHSKPPTFIAVTLADDTLVSGSFNQCFVYLDAEALAGVPFPASGSAYNYGGQFGTYMNSGSTSITSGRFLYPQGTQGSTSDYPSFFCSNTEITAKVTSGNKSWRADHKYVWIAVWVTVPTE